MKRIKPFAGDHPAWFAHLVLTARLVTGGIAVAFQLPLVIILLWFLLRCHPRSAFPEFPHLNND
jgi:hypothetical protein